MHVMKKRETYERRCTPALTDHAGGACTLDRWPSVRRFDTRRTHAGAPHGIPIAAGAGYSTASCGVGKVPPSMSSTR